MVTVPPIQVFLRERCDVARGINKVILIGNLGKDPEVRYTQGGQAVADLRVATTEAWTDKQGQRQEKTEWHRVVLWGKTAENAGKYLSKGRQIYVEGRLQTREWQDKEGQKRWTTEIVGNDVQFLGGGAGGTAGARGNDEPPAFDDYGGGAGGGAGGPSGGAGGPSGGGRPGGGGSMPPDDDIPF